MPSIGVSYRSKEMKSIRDTFAQAIVIVFINDRKTRRYPRNTAPSTKWAAGKQQRVGPTIHRAGAARKKGTKCRFLCASRKVPGGEGDPQTGRVMLQAQLHTISPHCVLLDHGFNRYINSIWENEACMRLQCQTFIAS